MPQLRSESQRPRTAPASQGSASSSLDLGTLHQALPSPTAPLVVQQNRRNLASPSPRQQLNGKQVSRPASRLPRMPKQPSDTEGNKVASTSKRLSTAESTRSNCVPVSSEGHRRRLSNVPLSRWTDVRRNGSANGTKQLEVETTPSVTKLPPDLLCQCLTSIESLYYLVNCASVCRAWRDALLSDMVWKPIYLRWWHLLESDDSLDGQASAANQVPNTPRNPPEGFDTWRGAFIGKFQKGKQKLLMQEKAQAVEKGYLHPRRLTDRSGKLVIDCAQGEAMWKLGMHLGLSFQVTLNRGRPFRLQGKGKVEMFESACILRYPVAGIGSLDLAALKSIEWNCLMPPTFYLGSGDCAISVLDPVFPFAEHTRLQMSNWEMVSTPSRSPGPLRLLQQRISSGVSIIVGTLTEESTPIDGFSGQEQLLLLVINVHLSDLLWKLMILGEGSSSRINRRIVGDELDPHYGLHSWHASVQFHTLGRNIWTRHFNQVFWSPRESTPGERAVFVLLRQRLPDSLGGLESLQELDITAVRDLRLSHSFGVLKRIQELEITLCRGLVGLSDSFRDLESFNTKAPTPGNFSGRRKNQHEVIPAVLQLPWKSEAFSGTLRGVYMLDFTLWNDGGEIAWQYSAAVRIDPAPLAVVEYGLEFDGERVHTLVADIERGVSLSVNMCIPLSITYWNTTADRPMIAITSLQLTLTSKFLESWCGIANI